MNIEELTKKIYEEGVTKAKQQEEELLDKARKEAERILADARKQAAEIVQSSRKEAEQSKARLASEMKLAGDQAVAEIRNRIVDCLVDNTLPKSIKAGLDDPRFMQELIKEIVGKWDASQTSIDLSVVLPTEARERVAAQFASKAKELFDRGIEVSYSDEVRSGFQIRPKDGSYRISFQEQDFVTFFRGFLRERTREILFPSANGSERTAGSNETGQGR